MVLSSIANGGGFDCCVYKKILWILLLKIEQQKKWRLENRI
jgi:hypothetical protein